MTYMPLDDVENGHPASRASVASVAKQVNEIGSDLKTLHDALVGVPGISEGVLHEIREEQKLVRQEWVMFQAHLPDAINAAIQADRDAKTKSMLKNATSWWIMCTSSAIAGTIVAILIDVFHVGMQVHP